MLKFIVIVNYIKLYLTFEIIKTRKMNETKLVIYMLQLRLALGTENSKIVNEE